MKSIENNKRSVGWDNTKGILIFLVVFAHMLYENKAVVPVGTVVDVIYFFHMPAFVFASGYFGKSENSRSAQTVTGLIFLYFVFNSITGFIYGFNNSLLEPLYSYWYILALVVWRLLTPKIEKIHNIIPILIIVSVFSGMYSSLDNTLAVARIIGFYPFYMAGYKLSFEKDKSLKDKPYLKKAVVGLLCVTLSFTFMFIMKKFLFCSDDDLKMLPYHDNWSAVTRILLYIEAFLAIYALRCIVPHKKLPFVNMLGRNTLSIYILHRPVTLFLNKYFATFVGGGKIILYSLLASIIICLVTGNSFVNKSIKYIASDAGKITKGEKTEISGVIAIIVAFIFMTGLLFVNTETDNSENTPENNETAVSSEMYAPISREKQEQFDNAFHMTFAGDLILLEDQVKRAYKYEEDSYDFSPMFEYAKKYIESADMAIGVFEGPMAGEEAGYSSSNFDDKKELALNFPDEFSYAVKQAGFDLVTTANNHLLDKGIDGATRTLDVLDKVGLEHTGSYRNKEEKDNSRIKIIEKEGIRFAFLSYTYGTNSYDRSVLTSDSMDYITSVIGETQGELFEKLKNSVEEDFKKAKTMDPDIIVVLPHIGTQFSNGIDSEQEVWFDIFKNCGADIILGDHTHAVGPIEMSEGVFTAYCPGNFANLYRENQGDTSALIDIYIDKSTKKVIGGGVIPLYTQSEIEGNYRALPIYDIENDHNLRMQLSDDDYVRASQANKTVTKVMLGIDTDISAIPERYLFDETGYLREKTRGLELRDDMKKGTLYTLLSEVKSVCFLGDSVTEGTKNNGVPWYEPLEEYTDDKEIYNFSKGGCTVKYLLDNAAVIPKAELYVVAIGTNDVRYRDESQCAMTCREYINRIDELKKHLLEKVPNAKILFIAPWYSTDGDIYSKLGFREKTKLNNEYSQKLQEYCKDNKLYFVNANNYIENQLKIHSDRYYLLDHIHPTAKRGVIMYCEGVLSG